MRTIAKSLLAAALVLGAGTFCYGADQIDNPMYTQWAKFNVGTSVTMKMETKSAQGDSTMERTVTLVDKAPDKLTLETKMSMNYGGKAMDMPASKQPVPAKIDKPEVTKTEAAKPEVKESTEEIDAAGKKVKAKVTETTMQMGANTMKSKVWSSDEIPGSMIKMESTMDGATKSTTTMTLTKCDIK